MLDYLWLIIIGLVAAYFIIRNLLALGNYSRWTKDSNPSLDAKITKIVSKPIFPGIKFVTKVTFSDGFRYYSHLTKVEQTSFTTRQFSVELDTQTEICEIATEKHKKAVMKKLKIKEPKTTQVPQGMPQQAKWTCTCGRVNAGYVSSCACGVSKREAAKR